MHYMPSGWREAKRQRQTNKVKQDEMGSARVREQRRKQFINRVRLMMKQR